MGLEMKIRAMNAEGIRTFSAYVDDLRAGRTAALPARLLFDDNYSVELGSDISKLDALNLEEKYEAATAIHEIVKELGLKSAERETGFWTWCSAYLFDRLCKKKTGGVPAPGESAIWIPQPDEYKRYYRHYLAGIWRVYSSQEQLGTKLKVLLTGPVNTPGELWAQIAANQDIVANSNLLEMIHDLYWDPENETRKYGASGESPRRLVKVINQLAKNWDFQSMAAKQILGMLPSEFDRFKA